MPVLHILLLHDYSATAPVLELHPSALRSELAYRALRVFTDDEEGLLVERTIAYRPFPAVKILRDKLYTLNAGKLPDDMWDYPTHFEKA